MVGSLAREHYKVWQHLTVWRTVFYCKSISLALFLWPVILYLYGGGPWLEHYKVWQHLTVWRCVVFYCNSFSSPLFLLPVILYVCGGGLRLESIARSDSIWLCDVVWLQGAHYQRPEEVGGRPGAADHYTQGHDARTATRLFWRWATLIVSLGTSFILYISLFLTYICCAQASQNLPLTALYLIWPLTCAQ
jgi:hypothetical protein